MDCMIDTNNKNVRKMPLQENLIKCPLTSSEILELVELWYGSILVQFSLIADKQS